jgi:type I site-specific restriction-modification system R (restriction) subunit
VATVGLSCRDNVCVHAATGFRNSTLCRLARAVPERPMPKHRQVGREVCFDTAGKRFAVIVDEAHSSQSGETATTLKGMLNKEGIEAAIAAQILEQEDDELSEEAKAAILRDSLKRARQPNLSFFAFTSTPKFKTKTLFDEPGPSGTSPFHEYTMRQATDSGSPRQCQGRRQAPRGRVFPA